MGEKGKMRETGGRGMMRVRGIDIEALRFYPLDPTLPPVVQLKLRCKEMNYLLDRLQKSLLEKMTGEETLSRKDKRVLIRNHERKQEDFDEELLRKNGLKRLENGQVVKDE